MKKLILIAHGESEWDRLNLFTGWTDIDLSSEGLEDARKVGRLLKSEGYYPQYCYTSFLKRAIKSLNTILDEMDLDWLPVEKHWRLNEKHYGAIQGLNKEDVLKQYGEEQVALWKQSFNGYFPILELNNPTSPRQDSRYSFLPNELIPLSESLKDVTLRVALYYYENIVRTFERCDKILIVAHSDSLRGIVKVLRNMTDEEISNFNFPAMVPYIFEFDDEINLKTDFFLGDPEEILRKMEGNKLN